MNAKLALVGGPKAVTRTEELREATRWPIYGDDEKQAVLKAMDSDNVYAATARFEQEFAAYHGAKYALAHCNGSCAIHAAYFAAGVGPGDEVITSSYTWHLQTDQIFALHALPVFCDIDPRSACIVPEEIRRKISTRTKAIVVVHPFGCVAPMDEIVAIGKEFGIPVIEDCSHAHGATYKGRKVGTFGDIGCFSLQASKLMNAIEGGILITDNPEYYSRACALAHYEKILQSPSEAYHKVAGGAGDIPPACFGFKYRMHPLGAAIASVHLRKLDAWNAIRRANHGYLTERFAEVGRGVFTPPFESEDMKRTWLNYICQFHAEYAGFPREYFIEALCAEGLPVTGGRAGYLPIYWNPIYQERMSIWADGDPFDLPSAASYGTNDRKVTYERGLCPVAETFWRRCINLPMIHRPVSRELLDEIVEAVDKGVMNLVEMQKRAYPSRAVAAAPRRESSPPRVDYRAPVHPKLQVERITDTGGCQHTGGTGRSCWGYHQSNLLRHGEDVYALVWRDDTHLAIFHRTATGEWESSPLLPESPQSGAMLVDAEGRLHLIAGDRGSYHAIFDPPGQVQKYSLQRLTPADTRFGAAIAPNGDIFVAGGMPGMRWYRLSAAEGYRQVQSGCIPHATNRAYYFTAFDGKAAHTYCTEVDYVESAGFQTTQTYAYLNPDLAGTPDDWRMTLISDVSDTFDGSARGTTGAEDLLMDRQGRLHYLTMVNPSPATGAWAASAQDRAQDELIHTIGTPGGPLQSVSLGNFARGRLCQTADGRLHYLLTRHEEGGSRIYFAVGSEDDFTAISEPVALDTPGLIDHLFVNAARAGGTLAEYAELYFTGPGYPPDARKTNEIWYGRLDSGA